jgi:hypothetical protein
MPMCEPHRLTATTRHLDLNFVIHHLRLRLVLPAVVAVLAAVSAVPALAAEAPPPAAEIVRGAASLPQEGTQESTHRVEPGLIWTLVGVGIGAAVFGSLYLFKRHIGAFPKNPAWVAPISVMPSSTFPDEDTFGDAAGGAHHAPAHH